MRNYCNGDCQKVKIKSECLPGGACKSKMELQQKTKNKYMLVGCQNMIMQNNASKPITIKLMEQIESKLKSPAVVNGRDTSTHFDYTRPTVFISQRYPICEGEHIMEYAGVIQELTTFKNYITNTNMAMSYIRVDEYIGNPLVINATVMGNEMSFLTPCVCDPNCTNVIWKVKDRYRVAIVGKKHI